jgi:hypothetical protein
MSENMPVPENAEKEIKFSDFLLEMINKDIHLLESAEAMMTSDEAKKKLKEAVSMVKGELDKEANKVRLIQQEQALDKEKVPDERTGPSVPTQTDGMAKFKHQIANSIGIIESELSGLRKQSNDLIKIGGSAGFGWSNPTIAVNILKHLAIIKDELKKIFIPREDGSPIQFNRLKDPESRLVLLCLVLAIHKGKDAEIPASFKEESQYNHAAGIHDGDVRVNLLISRTVQETASDLEAFVQLIQRGINSLRAQHNIPVAAAKEVSKPVKKSPVAGKKATKPKKPAPKTKRSK